MRTHLRRTAAALAAALLLATAVGTAGANRLSLGPSTEFTVTWFGARFFVEVPELGGRYVVLCPLTLQGAFHAATFAKTAGSLVGLVTSATVGTCTSWLESEGTIPLEIQLQVLRESLPWHLRYASFSGALPSITAVGLNMVGTQLRLVNMPFGETCLYASTAAAPLRYTAGVNRGEWNIFGAEERAPNMPLSFGEGCPEGGLKVAGNGSVTQTGSRTLLRLTLV